MHEFSYILSNLKDIRSSLYNLTLNALKCIFYSILQNKMYHELNYIYIYIYISFILFGCTIDRLVIGIEIYKGCQILRAKVKYMIVYKANLSILDSNKYRPPYNHSF